MRKLEILGVLDCSSEDSNNVADNVLLDDSSFKWKTAVAGELDAFIVLRLKRCYKIHFIEFTNAFTGSVEILVKNSTVNDEYFTLLECTTIMPNMDCLLNTNGTLLHKFPSSMLNGSLQKERWDTVKIICNQQWNIMVQFGLTTVNVYSSDPTEVCPFAFNAPDFNLRPHVPQTPSIDELYDLRCENENLCVPELIRQFYRNKRHEQYLINSRLTKSLQSKPSGKQDSKVDPSPTRPLEELFNDMTLVISVSNASKEIIHENAIKMGAVCKLDWDDSCTHLVSLTLTDPKCMHVKGVGNVVHAQWVIDCFTERKLLPWSDYALHLEEEEESDKRMVAKKSDEEQENLTALKTSASCQSMTLEAPEYPNLFNRNIFYIDPTFSNEGYDYIKWYIIAYNGLIIHETSEFANYAIAASSGTAEELQEDCPNAVVVNPAWIWASHNEMTLQPVDKFRFPSLKIFSF